MTINERLARLEKAAEDTKESMKQLTTAIYGNGKLGLLTEFQLLRKSVEEHHESIAEERKKSKNDWKWIATTAIALAAVGVSFFK